MTTNRTRYQNTTHTHTEEINTKTSTMEFYHIKPLCTSCVYGDGKTKSIALATIERFVAMGLLCSKTNMKSEEDLNTLVTSVCAASSKDEIGIQSIKTINTLALSNVLIVKGSMMMKLLESCVKLAGKMNRDIANMSAEQIVCVTVQRAQRDVENIPHVMTMIETLSSLVKCNSALSLRLLRVVLDEIPSDIVKENETFRKLIRHNVCTSLLKHSVSNKTATLTQALGVFILLMRRYRRFLRSQIEILMREIFFGMLESSNSSSEVKVLVLKMFAAMTKGKGGGQLFVEMFLTYDCETENASTIGLVENLVQILAQLVRSSPLSIQQAALSVIVEMTRSVSRFASLSSLSSAKEKEKKNDEDNEDDDKDAPALSSEEEQENNKNTEETVTLDNAEKLIKSRQAKQRHLQSAFKLYEQKAKKGIEYLTSKQIVENTAESVASFLYKHRDELNKSQTGEYLGSEKEFNLKVMHHFVDLNEFKSLQVDRAIRFLLSGFRLPGESQKIDRIMEKFAERYVSCNPDSENRFKSADDVFALSFAIIMLQTDLHSDQIRSDRKMTIEKFLSLTREFVSNDEEYLKGIYVRIKNEPITLVDDELEKLKRESETRKNRLRNLFRSKIDRRDSHFAKESELMIREATEHLRSADSTGSILEVKSVRFKQLKPLMNVMWRPLLMALHSASNTDGILSGCKIAARANLPRAVDAFIRELVSGTMLISNVSTRANSKMKTSSVRLVGLSLFPLSPAP